MAMACPPGASSPAAGRRRRPRGGRGAPTLGTPGPASASTWPPARCRVRAAAAAAGTGLGAAARELLEAMEAEHVGGPGRAGLRMGTEACGEALEEAAAAADAALQCEDGYAIPDGERDAINGLHAGASTPACYGEISVAGFAAVLGVMRLERDDVFYDLGSGTGKVVLQAALQTEVGRSVGLELSESRHKYGLAALAHLRERAGSPGAEEALGRCEFELADIQEPRYQDATHGASATRSDAVGARGGD